MGELLKVVLITTAAALLLLGAGTLIQLVEQMVRRPDSRRHEPI
ncbi:MAG TPA: hypothetical protein VNN19_13400 [bacterium]|nr:hypothetical protein [bacterium]